MMPRALWVLPLGFVCAGLVQAQNGAAIQGSDLTGAAATGLTGVVGIGVAETDNIYRTDSSKQSDAIGQVIADLTFEEDSRLIQAKAASNLAFLEYQADDYPSEVLGNFYGTGRLSISPDRFSWVLQENFGQQQITPGVPITPLDLENVNFVSTGPDITVPVFGQTDIRLSGRYSNVYYQTSDLDNNRLDGTFAIVERMSASTTISANAGIESIRYQDSIANPDFETQQAYMDLESRSARTTLSLIGGVDRVTGLFSEPTQPLVRLTVDHAITDSSRVTLAAGQEFSDSGNMLVQLQQLSGLSYGAAQSVASSDPFTDRYGRVAWQYDRLRTTLGFDVGRYQEVHLVESQYNQVRWVADVNFRRLMTPALTATITGGYLNDSYYDAPASSFRTLFESASLNWQVGKRLGVQFLYQHFGQTASTTLNEFDENRISALVSYALGRIPTIGSPGSIGAPAVPFGSGAAQY
jgi:hypothetical protein